MKKALLSLICIGIIMSNYAQDMPSTTNSSSRKGQMFFYWGYNRAFYLPSDVHLKGDGFDFTMHDARAEDMREPFTMKRYFDIERISIPQFNFRAGYFFRENTAISLGWDHMKYHIIPTQLLNLEGTIDTSKFSMPGYSGTFNHTPYLYNKDFMDFHHSNGFNYVRAAIEQRLPIWMSKNGKHQLAANTSASAGMLFTWTDFTFFGDRYLNKLHLSGVGLSLTAGLRFEFFKYFFIQGQAQCGWSGLTNIQLMTVSNRGLPDQKDAKGRQNISFMERSWAFGAYIPIGRKK